MAPFIRHLEEALAAPLEMAQLVAREPDSVLLMPVRGVAVKNVADTWGAPRSGDREHKGQDIFAKKGTPVVSATEGYVMRITGPDTNRLGGNAVFVFGAGRHIYYYAHLDSVHEAMKVGAKVSTTTVLGFVGQSGNAAGTPPHLHFGIYARGGAIDPLPLLIDRT